LLGVREQVAGGERAGAQALDGAHDIVRLGEENFAELFRPSEIFVHPADSLRIVCEGPHAVVPRLAVDLRGVAVGLEIARGQDDLGGRGRGGEHNCDQSVGVERNGAEEFVELLGEEESSRRSEQGSSRGRGGFLRRQGVG
jgi:hypothetical protein